MLAGRRSALELAAAYTLPTAAIHTCSAAFLIIVSSASYWLASHSSPVSRIQLLDTRGCFKSLILLASQHRECFNRFAILRGIAVKQKPNDELHERQGVVDDLHRLMERGDCLRVALAWHLEENARLRDEFARFVAQRMDSAKRIQRLLGKQMA